MFFYSSLTFQITKIINSFINPKKTQKNFQYIIMVENGVRTKVEDIKNCPKVIFPSRRVKTRHLTTARSPTSLYILAATEKMTL